MPRQWVVNASPLILLGKVGRSRLLCDLTDELIIPDAVAREVGVKSDGERQVQELLALPDVRLESAIAIPREVEAWDLGSGESEVISQALATEGSRAVVDDLEARRCALALGVEVVGTLGAVLRAKHSGLIPAARPIVARLREVGLYVSDQLVEKALAHLNE
ncbi:MAG: DUF3368 domain-containing protein [Deltaproteobacteria bacterium]|nr:DUF3368 domain-containing protein [Deltaproteobacteria bacterium]